MHKNRINIFRWKASLGISGSNSCQHEPHFFCSEDESNKLQTWKLARISSLSVSSAMVGSFVLPTTSVQESHASFFSTFQSVNFGFFFFSSSCFLSSSSFRTEACLFVCQSFLSAGPSQNLEYIIFLHLFLNPFATAALKRYELAPLRGQTPNRENRNLLQALRSTGLLWIWLRKLKMQVENPK